MGLRVGKGVNRMRVFWSQNIIFVFLFINLIYIYIVLGVSN
jgi:hypothetical protein